MVKKNTISLGYTVKSIVVPCSSANSVGFWVMRLDVLERVLNPSTNALVKKSSALSEKRGLGAPES